MHHHPSADNCIKALSSKALSPQGKTLFSPPSPSHQEAYTCLLASSIRGQAEEARRTIVPQQLDQKPYYRKLIRMKKQRITSQVNGQDKIPEKQLNGVMIGKLLEEEFRIMIVKMIQDHGNRIETMQEMFTKDLEN